MHGKDQIVGQIGIVVGAWGMLANVSFVNRITWFHILSALGFFSDGLCLSAIIAADIICFFSQTSSTAAYEQTKHRKSARGSDIVDVEVSVFRLFCAAV